jgi:photosystem I P700 chlorophyll a apoprotein A1
LAYCRTGNINADVGEIFKVFKLLQDFSNLALKVNNLKNLACIRKFSNVRANVFVGWFHYHKAAEIRMVPNESMLNHHLSGLLGLGSLSWAGHQIHIDLTLN